MVRRPGSDSIGKILVFALLGIAFILSAQTVLLTALVLYVVLPDLTGGWLLLAIAGGLFWFGQTFVGKAMKATERF